MVYQRNRTNRMHIFYLYSHILSIYICLFISTYRETDFNELAYMTMGAGKSKICRTGQQAGNSGRISLLQSWGRIPFLGVNFNLSS